MRLGAWRAIGGGIAAVIAFFHASSAGATPQLRLVYVREAGAEACPPEMELRMAVAARLGYDPFTPTVSGAVVARVARDAEGFEGSVELVDEAGISRGKRELATNSGRCDELARAMALSISIAIDPEAASEDLEEAPLPPPASTQPAATAPGVDAASRAADPGQYQAEEGAAVSGSALATTLHGIAPALAFGGVASAQVRVSSWSGGAGLRLMGSPYGDAGGASELSTTLLAGDADGCFHGGALAYCVASVAGALWASSRSIVSPGTDVGAFVAAGGRLKLHFPLTPDMALLGQAEVLATLYGPAAAIDDREIWRPEGLLFGGGAGLSVKFR